MKINKIDWYVITSIALGFISFLLVLYVAFKVQYEPSVTTGLWFAFLCTEVWHCSRIKNKKKGDVNENEIDE